MQTAFDVLILQIGVERILRERGQQAAKLGQTSQVQSFFSGLKPAALLGKLGAVEIDDTFHDAVLRDIVRHGPKQCGEQAGNHEANAQPFHTEFAAHDIVQNVRKK